ncbi:MAG: glycosyltransferase family 1 protein [Nitrospirae bacterium]|nr:MAG: glycosyltransferase family 1 protein [Nitrospirota bacterium]
MRILQLVYESLGSPFGFGGAGVRAYEIYKRLAEKHDITLLCMKYPGSGEQKEIEGLRHIFVGSGSANIYRSVLSYTAHAMCYLKKYSGDYDIVVENFLPSTPFLSRFLSSVPVVLQLQGIMGRHAIKKFGLFPGLPMYIVEVFYPGLYKNYITVSMEDAGNLQKKGKRFFFIPNGVNPPEPLNIHKRDDYLLFLSRIDIYTKGLDILMDAFIKVAKKFPSIRLVLAGYEFNNHETLFERVPSELKERVEYRGFVVGKEKWNLLRQAKVFLLPSRHEANPVSLIEALSVGTPAVVSDIPQMRYVGEDGYGLTFRAGSSADLAKKITVMLEDDDLRKRCSERGIDYASRFRWDRIAEEFERALYEVKDG